MRTHPRASMARIAGGALLVAGALALAGCWNPFSPNVLGRGVSTAPPVPSSASNTLLLLKWAYENRSFSEYRELFTADYRFVFAAADSNGDQWRDNPWPRDDELESARKLFEGGDVNQPAASQITLLLDGTLRETNDTRPGKYDPLRRKTIRTSVTLNITDVNGTSTNVYGKALFFLVRGDSADIPADLGFGPDPNRWYIERWEDETQSTGPAALMAPAAGTALAVGDDRAEPGVTPVGLRTLRPVTALAPAGPVPRPATSTALTGPFGSWGAIKAWYRR